MEFPVCPSCGQSVIDDDAEECPFCGASMSGKPSGKPAPKPVPKAAAPKAASGAAPAAKGAAAAGAAKRARPSADEPVISADDTALKRAVPASRKPSRGRMHRVVCPMCDTQGFVPEQAAGKDVRCANPECLVPIFTAPALEKKVVQQEPAKKGVSGPVVMVGGLALVALLGFGLWYFLIRQDAPAEMPPLITSAPGSGGDAEPFVGFDNPDKILNPGQASTQNAAQVLTPAQIRERALEDMIKTSLQSARNRSKPFCRQLTAEAYAISGNLEGARQQLEALKRVGGDVPYYQVIPQTEIGWQELERGQSDAARQTAATAWDAAQKLPRVGRGSVDAAMALAALLVAVDRTADAKTLIQKHQPENAALAELSALVRIAQERRTFNVDAAAAHVPLQPWTAPQWVAVTLGLVARDRADLALTWAGEAPSEESRSECIAAWGEAIAAVPERGKSAASSEKLQQATQKLPPAGKARVFARVAAVQLAAGNRAAAEQSLETARGALNEISPPAPSQFPEMKRVLAFNLPDPVPLRMAAIAAAEIARAEAQLGNAEAAWNSMTTALKFTRAMAPSPSGMRDRRKEVEEGGLAFRETLKRGLELKNDDEVRRALSNYRKKVIDLADASEARFRLQTELLAEAAEWGLQDQVWGEVVARAEHSDANEREPYLATTLPDQLVGIYKEAGASDKVRTVEAALQGAKPAQNARAELRRATNRMIDSGELKQAAARISQSTEDEAWRQQWALRLACRLASRDAPKRAMEFVAALNDLLLREEAYDLCAAIASRNGHSRMIWDYIQAVELTATEEISLYRGLVAGISAAEKAGAKPREQTALAPADARR